MTQTKVLDLTMSTIAVVVDEPTSPPRITDADIRLLLRPPFSIGQLVTGEATVSSNRDQIDVIFGPTKINVRDLRGNSDFTNSKIATIVHAFLDFYKTKIRSYGVNFAVTVDMDAPEVWIRDKLLNVALAEITGKELLSGRAAHISLQADPKTWNIRFERNADGKLEINFNASQEAAELPATDMLTRELKEQYQGFMDLIVGLGL